MTFEWFVAAWLLSSPALAQRLTLQIEEPSPGVTVFTFSNARYGSLEFDGSVERVDFGDEWEFRTHLNVTFHANAEVNRVSVVDLTRMELDGTVPPQGQETRW